MNAIVIVAVYQARLHLASSENRASAFKEGRPPRYQRAMSAIDTNFGVCLAVGIGIGIAVGAAIGNIGVGIALGAGIGSAVGAALLERKSGAGEGADQED